MGSARLARWCLGAAVAGLAATLPARASAGAATVDIQHYAYAPADLAVHVGDAVTWTNHDEAPHDITGTSGPESLRSPELQRGGSWTFVFQEAGTYTYYCSVHPDMKASVTVAPTVLATTTAPTAAPTTARRPAVVSSRTPASPTPPAAPTPPVTIAAAAPLVTTTTTTTGPTVSARLVAAAVGAALLVILVLTLAGSSRRTEP